VGRARGWVFGMLISHPEAVATVITEALSAVPAQV
jgi:hypothetical protein